MHAVFFHGNCTSHPFRWQLPILQACLPQKHNISERPPVRCPLSHTVVCQLNTRSFLDKTGRTGGTAQYINGAALLGTFFSARIVWGWYKTFDMYQTLWMARHEVPLLYIVLYGGGSSALHSLNAVW